MIKNGNLYQNLLLLLRNRIPQNSKLVAKLADILSLEREAIYRRIRQKVAFTFEEIAIISKEFNISLDNMLGTDARTTHPFRFQPFENENPVVIDYLLLDEYIQAIKDVASDSDGEISFITNILPQPFYTGFKFIFHFYCFKWRYYSNPSYQTKLYHEIILPDRLIQAAKDIFVFSKKIKTNYFILDNKIFQNFVNDVIYFNNIRLVRDEDVFHIKDELLHLLDYMETVAKQGFVDNPENKVFIYNSDTNIDASYYYIDSHSFIRFALIESFIFNGVLIFDEETLKMMKYRIRPIIKTSTLLSVTGEKQRMSYFEEQRKIVEQL